MFILTTGLSGSSVVTGLIKQAGYWCGEKTEFKKNSTGHYETFENSRFVELNNQLIQLSGISIDEKFWYRSELRQRFADLYHEIDCTEFREFLRDCDRQKPWVLKDPKLWLTIGFWAQLLTSETTHFIVLQREVGALWHSQVLKRIIYDYPFLARSEQQTKQDLLQFLNDKGCSHMELVYDDLMAQTENSLLKLNQFLGTQLNLSHWNAVYKAKKSGMKWWAWTKVILIYLKNYNSRII